MSPKAQAVYGHIVEDTQRHGYWKTAARDATVAEYYRPAWLPAKIMPSFRMARHRDDTPALVSSLKNSLGAMFTDATDADWTAVAGRLFQDGR